MIAKRHRGQGRVVLALCDDSLLGEVFRSDGLKLDLSSSFYDGENMSISDAMPLLKEANTINAVGKECIKALIAEGYIGEKDVKEIAGIPHVQVVK